MYLSHNIHLRKPDQAIFKFVLEDNGLKINETYFIEDSLQHIESARKLNINIKLFSLLTKFNQYSIGGFWMEKTNKFIISTHLRLF